jgi:hypothetical protein
LQGLHLNPKKVCNDLHTRQFCSVSILKLLDASNKSVRGCLFFGCSLCVLGVAPLNIFGSVKGRKTVFLSI